MRSHLLFAAVLAWVISGVPTIALAAAGLHEEIDRAIAAKADGPMAAPADDSEFLRRASLDFSGNIPTADEARKFLADKDPDKRSKLIEQFIASPQWATRMEQALTVMLLERRTGGKVPDEKWREWLRGQFAKNRPWNEVVRELFVVDGDPKNTPAAKFIANEEKFDADAVTQNIGRLFLGMDLKCAQCHDHPVVDGFTQADYFGILSFLNPTKLDGGKKDKNSISLADGAMPEKVEFKSVFKKEGDSTSPHMPGEKPVVFTPGNKPLGRVALAAELPAQTNERFVQNAVNRFWWLLMGRGLVQPLHEIHDDNPPSHPELMNLMCQEFVAHNFDVQWLMREISLSQAYQRSSRAPEGVKVENIPSNSFRVANMKPLSPEEMVNAVLRSAGELEAMEQAKDGSFSLKGYITGTSKEPPQSARSVKQVFVGIFGNPAGEPEVHFAPGMSHTLFLMNDRIMLGLFKPNDHNLIGRLAKLPSPGAVAEEMYLSILTRKPLPEEEKEVSDYLVKNGSRRDAALGELAWALLAGAEFRLNH